MMNKKAIAAFAAGATLLAGFAMATPAMAVREDNPCNPITKAACTVRVENARADYNAASTDLNNKQASYDKAVAAYESAKTKAAETAKASEDALKKAAADYNKGGEAYKVSNAAYIVAKAAADAAKTAADAAKTAVDKALDELQDAKKSVADTKAVLDQVTADFFDKYPAPKTLEEKQKVAIADVYAAKQKVDQAEQDFAHTHEAFVEASKKLKAANAQLEEAQVKLDAAKSALEDFEASGVKDEAKHERLVTAYNRAVAHVNRVNDTVLAIKTLPAYKDAKKANDAAQAAYNAAVEAYKAAYNHAVELDVNPDLLPRIVTMDPLAADFPELAEAQKIYDDALSGKFGAAAQKAVQKAEAKTQAAAPAAAAGKAGAAAGKAAAAKGELAAKGGNGHGGKAGEKLGNAGVGVALTALAASMLAGMGAAVRKMRH